MIKVIRTLLHASSQIKFMYEVVKTIHDNKHSIRHIKIGDPFYSKNPFDIATAGIILNYVLIQSCGWIEEYDKGFVPHKFPEYSDRIIQVKKILKPAKKRISDWKDLQAFRNQILAHSFKKNDSYILSEGNLTSYRIPRTNTEIFLLSNIIFFMMTTISKHFPEIIEELNISKSINDYLDIELNEVDVERELEDIKNKVKPN